MLTWLTRTQITPRKGKKINHENSRDNKLNVKWWKWKNINFIKKKIVEKKQYSTEPGLTQLIHYPRYEIEITPQKKIKQNKSQSLRPTNSISNDENENTNQI